MNRSTKSRARRNRRRGRAGAAPGRPQPVAAARLPPTRDRRATLLHYALVVVLLVQMLLVMVLSGREDVPTYDEPAHLASGVAYTSLHDLRFNPEHPPLAKALAGAFVSASGATIPSEGPEFTSFGDYSLGSRLLYGSGNDPDRVMALARTPIILLTLVLAGLVYVFARGLFGAAGGLLALAFLAFEPNVLAHGRLVTTDVPAALFLTATLWAVWRMERRGVTPRSVVLVGVLLGLALATKYSALFFLPVVLSLCVVAAVRRTPWRQGGALRGVKAAVGAGLVAVVVVWSVYLAIDPRLGFDRTLPVADAARGLSARVADLLPFPDAYRQGVRFVIASDQGGRASYLFGELYQNGRLIYYPAVLLMKTPITTLLAWLAATVVLVRCRRADVALYVGVPAVWMMLFASTSNTNIGVRHVMLVTVLGAVATGALAASGLRLRWLAAVLAAGTAISSLLAAPHHIPYVNLAFGGSSNAGDLMSDSNVDWGQDLKRLKDRLEQDYPGEVPWLLYFGTALPDAYGLQYRDALQAQPGEVRGLVAISITAKNSFYPGLGGPLAEQGTLLGRVGDSIELYRIP